MSANPVMRRRALSRETDHFFPARGVPSGGVHVVAIGLYLSSLLLMLAPVLTSSIGGDDQHWIMESPYFTDGSFLRVVEWSFSDIPSQTPDDGRFAQLAYVLQRTVDIITMNAAVALSLPPFIVRAAVKLTFLGIGLLTIIGLAATLRTRSRQGEIVQLSAASRRFLALALPVVVVLGVNAEVRGTLNGWLDYPTLTYGAIAVIFGVPWLLLVVQRLLIARFWAWLVPSLVIACATGIMLNISYELFYLAFPASILLLLLQPASANSNRPRRAKAVLIGALVVSFVSAFTFTRLYVSRACMSGECYAGVVPDLDFGVVKTAVMNFIGSFPGASQLALSRMLEVAGSPNEAPRVFDLGALLVGVMLAASAGAILYFSGKWDRQSAHPKGAGEGRIDADRRILAVVAATAILVAVGAATIMALSSRAQDYVDSTFIPYRNGPVTWVALSISFACIASILMSSGLRRSIRVGVGVSGLLVVAVIVSITLPSSVLAAKVARQAPQIALVDQIHHEVGVGELGAAADARRCATIADFDSVYGGELHSDRIVSGAYRAFEHYYGTLYCSEKLGHWDYQPTTDYY